MPEGRLGGGLCEELFNTRNKHIQKKKKKKKILKVRNYQLNLVKYS